MRLYHQMGLNGPKTTISHINFFCKNREFMLSNLINIITCSIANVSICLYPSLPVEWGAVVFLCWRAISPYKFSRIALTRSTRPLGCMNFHENIGTRSYINASCCWMLLTRSKSLKRPYDQLFYKMRKCVRNDYFLG